MGSDDAVELAVRESEGQQEAWNGRDAGRLVACPLLGGLTAAFRTVSISAGMVAIMLPLTLPWEIWKKPKYPCWQPWPAQT